MRKFVQHILVHLFCYNFECMFTACLMKLLGQSFCYLTSRTVCLHSQTPVCFHHWFIHLHITYLFVILCHRLAFQHRMDSRVHVSEVCRNSNLQITNLILTKSVLIIVPTLWAPDMRLFIFTAMKIHVIVFWVMAPCSVVVRYQRFRQPCCLKMVVG